jgi:hypothetical protein
MRSNQLIDEAKAALQYIRSRKFVPSFSSLSALLPCNLSLKKYITNKLEKEKSGIDNPTDAMILGSCLDRYIFEFLHPLHHDKESFALPYVSMQYSGNLTTKEGRAAKQKALERLAVETENLKALGFASPFLLKDEQINALLTHIALLEFQYPPNLGVSLYELLVTYATEVQKQISIPLPATYHGNCQKAKGVIDAYGYNPITGRYYLLDLKRMPAVSTDKLFRTIKDRKLAMQIALYKKGLESIGMQVDDCYILALDGKGNSNIYQFTPIELSNAWRDIVATANRLDELIENGEPEDMLKSFCETYNCAIH